MNQDVHIDLPAIGEQTSWQQLFAELDEQLLSAHARDDREALVQLYTQAADAAESHHDPAATRFYLTHAYVFALDTGSAECPDLKRRLDVYHAQLS